MRLTTLRLTTPLTALLLFALPLAAQVKFTEGSDRVIVEINGRPFTSLFFGSAAPKPYLHPLRSATGKVVTRSYPMELVKGEALDHKHHRGLWFTHGDVNGFDFWANEPDSKGGKPGKVVLQKLVDAKGGKKEGKLVARFDWTDPQSQRLLTETQTMTFYAQPDTLRMVDVDIELAPEKPVTFGDTKEGTFAIRLGPGFNEKTGTGRLANADGAEGMQQVWGKRAPWAEYRGSVEGEALGVAIFDHPANPRHPTYWHARDYGLFAANPFGEHDFLNDKTRNGSLTMQPNMPVRFRYRVVIYPGAMQRAEIDGLYRKYALSK